MNVYGPHTSPVVLSMQNSVISTRITFIYRSQWFLHAKTATFGAELQLSMGPRLHLSFSASKTAWIASELLVSMGPSPHLWFLYAKQRLVDLYTSLYGYQTSPVVLCIKTSVISTRNTSFYGFQPSSVVLYMKTVTLGPDLQVCMCPRLHLWSWALITARLAQEWKDYIGSIPHLWFCACKTATLGLEIHVSVGPRPHIWFLHAKQRLLDQNKKCLWVPDHICRFLHVKQRE